jgi:nicotinamide mononucleotide transporter
MDALPGSTLQTIEWVAALLALVYLLLAVAQHRWCWPAALLSSLLYAVVMDGRELFLQTALQLFYAAMALYGAWQWRPRPEHGDDLAVSRWPWQRHVPLLLAAGLATALSGLAMARYTAAPWPFLDAFLSWGAVAATYLSASKVLENWHYWMVLNSLSVPLYLQVGLWPTAALYAVYLVLAVVGWWRWRRAMAGAPP